MHTKLQVHVRLCTFMMHGRSSESWMEIIVRILHTSELCVTKLGALSGSHRQKHFCRSNNFQTVSRSPKRCNCVVTALLDHAFLETCWTTFETCSRSIYLYKLYSFPQTLRWRQQLHVLARGAWGHNVALAASFWPTWTRCQLLRFSRIHELTWQFSFCDRCRGTEHKSISSSSGQIQYAADLKDLQSTSGWFGSGLKNSQQTTLMLVDCVCKPVK